MHSMRATTWHRVILQHETVNHIGRFSTLLSCPAHNVLPLLGTTLTNDHLSHTTTFRVTDCEFCLYTNPSRATIPLIRPHQCDSEGGRIRGVLLYHLHTNRTYIVHRYARHRCRTTIIAGVQRSSTSSNFLSCRFVAREKISRCLSSLSCV